MCIYSKILYFYAISFSLNTIRRIYQETKSALGRFPLPIVISLVAFGLYWIESRKYTFLFLSADHHTTIRLMLEAIGGISLFIAIDFFAVSKHIDTAKRIGLYLLAFCILGLHFYSISPVLFNSEGIFFSRYFIFYVCYHLIVSCATFYTPTETLAYWRYNYHLFLTFSKSTGYSLSIFLGLASAIWAIDNLFGMHFSKTYYSDIFGFCVLVLNTLFFLMGVENDLNSFKKHSEYRQSVRIFTQYILIPLAIIYMSILYIYMFKILLQQRIPNGWICIPILTFSGLGILAYLLIYPVRKDANFRPLYIFSRYFFYIILPLLTLYFIAIFLRIIPYGLTENRYLILALGVWLVIVSLYIILSKKDNILFIPLSLLTILSISATGPWGMYQLSTQHQFLKLEQILKKNNLLSNHKIIDLNDHRNPSIDPKESESIRSILVYLNKRGKLGKVTRWFGEKEKNEFDNIYTQNESNALLYILDHLALDHYDLEKIYEVHSENKLLSSTISVSGYRYLAPFIVMNNECYNASNIEICLTDTCHLNIWFFDNKSSVNLNPAIDSLLQYIQLNKTDDGLYSYFNNPNYNYTVSDSLLTISSGSTLVRIEQIGFEKSKLSTNRITLIQGQVLLK